MILERMEGPTPPHLASAPPLICWPLGHWVQVVGKWLLGDSCQVTTVVSRAEGSHQLVGQEKCRWASSGVLAGHEGGPAVLCPHPATRDPAQEQKGDEGEEGRGRARAPRTTVGGARTPQAWPRKVWLLGVAAAQGELLCPGPGLPPRTDPWKGLLTYVGTHVPADSPPLARTCQPIEQCQHLRGTPCCQTWISGEGAR